MASRTTFTPPEQFEEYRILRPLGGGAMGQVYLAQDTLLDRSVAIKFVANFDADKVSSGELRERFFIEARAIARLQHPNVVFIYRIGEWQRRPYLVSEFVRGESLDRIEKPLSWQRAHRIGIGLSRGLAAAHRRGVLHRDIKPANAMLTPAGEIKLLDFGLAKLVDVMQVVSGPQASVHGSFPPESLLRDTQLDLLPLGHAAGSAPRRGSRDRPSLLDGEDVSATLPQGVQPVAAPSLDAQQLGLDATQLPQLRDSAQAELSSSLTQVGDVIGSPLYMAPEIWRGEPASRQADIYSLGTLLYELCSGRAPHEGLAMSELPLRVQELDARPLAEAAPEADPRFCAIVDRCLRRSPAARYESGDALRAALEQLAVGAQKATVVPEGNPYRGLQSFEKHHRGLFFGRSGEISAIVDRLRSESLILVAGNSGVGKSSLCKAGVLALIEAGALGPLQIVSVLPGRHPKNALAQALIAALSVDEEQLRRDLESDPAQIGRALCQRNRQKVQAGEPPDHLLLFIDQLEELVTQAEPTEAALVAEALAALIAYGPDVRVLSTVRGDFLSRLSALPGLGPEVARGLHLIGPLFGDGLREAITQPALALGYAFESAAFVETLVAASGQSDGGLPLLQFTLAMLWEARDVERRIIPASALTALGGVGGALSRHADSVYDRLPEAEKQATRRILGQLVTVEGTRKARRRVELLGAASEREASIAALEALTAGRILSARSDETTEGSTYELSHEALLSSWGTLRIWLAEDAQQRTMRQRLAHSAGEWERLGRGRELLWQKRQLAEAAAVNEAALSPRELHFLRRSRRVSKLRRAGSVLLIGALPFLLLLLYAAASLRARQALSNNIDERTTQAQRALAQARELRQRLSALQKSALFAYDARQYSEGDKLWEQAVELSSETRQQYAIASRTAEAALLLDTKRPVQRQLVGSILFESALLTERGHRLPRESGLYQRLLLYDFDGAFQKQWEAPAHVEIDSEPRGAVATLVPIDRDYHYVNADKRSLGRTPLASQTLLPGGYLLTITAPDRVEVSYPLLLRRGETLKLRVPLPTPEQVPPGFAYVPPGRFLFGSAADEEQRRGFLFTVPLHEVQAAAFLIAQHETTYAEWLSFLRALPAAERHKHLPRASQEGIAGFLTLRELSDGKFELVTQPSQQAYRAREGERIVYPG